MSYRPEVGDKHIARSTVVRHGYSLEQCKWGKEDVLNLSFVTLLPTLSHHEEVEVFCLCMTSEAPSSLKQYIPELLRSYLWSLYYTKVYRSIRTVLLIMYRPEVGWSSL